MCIISQDWTNRGKIYFALLRLVWVEKPAILEAGRKEAILQQRKEKNRLTLERRKQYNLNPNNNSPDQCQVANSV
jgi:hypothetical protein